jgi:hypothetical protein
VDNQEFQRHMEWRKEELPFEGSERRRGKDRRKEELPFDGPERRRGKDRRQYVRRVMTGKSPLPDQERDSSR